MIIIPIYYYMPRDTAGANASGCFRAFIRA